MVSAALASRMCIRLASIRSSYSHRRTTRCAIYSKTSETPEPVFAEVKKSFGPRAGGGGKINPGEEGKGPFSGVVEVELDAVACSLAKRLGVIVTALPELVLPVERVVIRRARTLELGLREATELDHGSGELRADW